MEFKKLNLTRVDNAKEIIPTVTKIMIEVATTKLDPNNDMMIITELKYYYLVGNEIEIPTRSNIISVIKEFNKIHKFRINPIIIKPGDKEESYISRVTYEQIKEKEIDPFPYSEFPPLSKYKTLGIDPKLDGDFTLIDKGFPAEEAFRLSNKIITID